MAAIVAEDEALIQQAIAHDLGAMRSRFPGKVTVTHYEELIDRLQEGSLVIAEGKHPELGQCSFTARYDAVADVFNVLMVVHMVKAEIRDYDVEGVIDWLNAVEQDGGKLYVMAPDNPQATMLHEAIEALTTKREASKQAAPSKRQDGR